jgi:tetratricopeptide (TPR) repeat protein
VNEEALFPSYIRRDQEQQIREQAELVREDRISRAVLLYGPGGVGKTRLVRQLAQASAADSMTVWLEPIDIDDSEYWLLSNLERLVARQLDPGNQYFGPYLEYLSRLPGYTRPRIGHETVVSHLGRIKRVFVECYTKFVKDSGKTVVIAFDTVEAIRGMYLLLTLTQWIKSLPATLFILSGRPLPGHGDWPDPIKNELEDPYQSIPVTTIRLDEFTQEAALGYIDNSGVASGLTDDEKAKLVRLTRGHPLWLAFTIAYLDSKGIPEEAQAPLAYIEREMPYRGDMTQAGQSLHEEFKRRLVSPYRETDFWHEAVKRLSVVRESVNQPIWQQLMGDRPLPEGVASLDEAWEQLLHTPWIRPRANRRSVTLHDAVAEELAQRIIPLHDQDKHWRRELWLQAARIYGELIKSRETELAGKMATLDDTLQLWDARPRPEGEPLPPTEEESAFIQDAARIDAQRRDLCQLKAVRLYYEILCDFTAGCRQFLVLLDQARDAHDILFQDLLAFEMQRFLPGAVHAYAFGDVIGQVIDDFRAWLSSGGQELYLEVGLSMADYLVRDEQPKTAIDLLDRLPEASADHGQRYRLSNLRGNACMRIPGRVKSGRSHFLRALQEARELGSPDQLKLVAAAHKELGFYYRNEGLWEEADGSYQDARDAISETLSARSSDEDREEMASIQTNWAYVKGLGGSYRDGTNLVESAITVRHRLKKYQEEGISWSVCGEVYRYERRFQKAWKAYAEAEQIFQGQRNWSWLGLVYQEQAICLFQATQDGISLTPGREPIGQAKRLITLALDLCRDLAVRGQPSALNRAGRIFGQEDFDAGLDYLAQGIDWARRLSDGWFWFANLIEYAELSYRAWVSTRRRAYRDQIAARAAEIDAAIDEYEFPDLKGRWNLLHGHLGIHDSLATGDTSQLSAALLAYKEGFAQIAQGYVGSSGAAAVAGEFKTFGELIWQLPPAVRAEWQDELRGAWSNLQHGSTLLLARLEELY